MLVKSMQLQLSDTKIKLADKQAALEKTHDLKIALKSSFPPASFFPNFHLYFKKNKLSLKSRVAAVINNDGEFVSLVPYVKKEHPQTPKPDLLKPSLSSSERRGCTHGI
ncbi:PREDICTED: uncharacterized protein LOC104769510 [Camelina sativa]|uniref:Uncharacterized protein LOC104769510 n=1 Tax=Camelina sativa TaxID=90675 RepID=A0ABM0XWJ8_CAMSA|nr:PREDICTED: uncharacterized protein LOC104769510 [Camelina sativa]